MNYQKFDTALSMALNHVDNPNENCLVVFIHTQATIDSGAKQFLKSLGISNITEDKQVYTATVSLNIISELSEKLWVDYLKLSQRLHLAQ
ncbi:MAG: hypothetical protein AAF378_16310 [Cyanobacteria bacterium P01_A01_bin.84]